MKKQIILFLLVALVICMLTACGCKHTWQEATCFAPKTCTKCNETEGEAEAHVWADATCLAPKTCTKCGSTMGEANAHNWTEATCLAPKTCADCGTTEGAPMEHVWSEATCTVPKTCANCGATEGEAAAHDVVFVDLDENVYTGECKNCGETFTETLEDPAAFATALLEGQWSAVTKFKVVNNSFEEEELEDYEMSIAIDDKGTIYLLPDNTEMATLSYLDTNEEGIMFECTVESQTVYYILQKDNTDVLYLVYNTAGEGIKFERQ